MMMSIQGKSLCLISFSAAFHVATSQSSSITVHLGYATYQGTAQSNGQNQFLGIRFAAPPLRNLRFRKPQPPVVTPDVQQADTFGPTCYGTGASLSSASEDCLFLNIWAPSATSTFKFPVFFWIRGNMRQIRMQT